MGPLTARRFEPPCAPRDTPFRPGLEWSLASGVLGWAFAHGDRIVIPMIIAEQEGAGEVGSFLDALSDRCVIVTVTSPRLEGMLRRRGYRCRLLYYEGELLDGWSRA
jgi:hypothetical protein